MRARVPTALADNTYEAFPEGTYTGAIDEAKVVANDDGSWQGLQLTVAEINPVEGTADPGRERFSASFTLFTQGVDARQVEDFTDRDLPFGIRRTGGLLASLSEALGIADRDGGFIDFDVEAVVDALTNGEFSGDRVGFEVTHYEDRDGNVRDQYDHFGPA